MTEGTPGGTVVKVSRLLHAVVLVSLIGCAGYLWWDYQQACKREFQAQALVLEAEMAFATPVIPLEGSPELDVLGVGPDAVIKKCDEAIALAPRFGKAYALRAAAYAQKGDRQRSRENLVLARQYGFQPSQEIEVANPAEAKP